MIRIERNEEIEMENKVFTVKSLNSLSTNNKIKDQVLEPQSIEFKKCYDEEFTLKTREK